MLRTFGSVPSLVGVEVLVDSIVEASVGRVLLGRGLHALPETRSAVMKAARASIERIVNECNDGLQMSDTDRNMMMAACAF